ncbi:hypothetical protein V6C27_12110 [Peptococcaceae bacterium 1198_IL3148]
MEDNSKKGGLEQTVVDLLQAHAQHGVDQTNMLLMLSLVNLMGIVDILQHSTAGVGSNVALQRGEMLPAANGVTDNPDLMKVVQQAASGEIDPLQLLSLLNQPGGQMPNTAALMGMLSQMMPPPPPRRDIKPPPSNQPPRENIKPQPAAAKEYKNNQEKDQKESENTTTNNKSYLKWDPRLG